MADRLESTNLPPWSALPPFAALRAFDAVARLGGIRKAAQELRLDHAVVSRHVKALESWVGTLLLRRGRVGSLLTAEGERFHGQVAAAIDLIATATVDIMKASAKDEITIWAMPGIASKWLLLRIAAFQTANPSITIEVRPSDRLPDFNRHEADVDIIYAPTYGAALAIPPNVRALEIASPVVVPVASPAYLAGSPPIRLPSDLLTHSLLHEEDFENWRAWLSAHDVVPSQPLTGLRLWHAHLTIDAAIQGRGIALANHFLAHDDLAAGRLVEIVGADAPSTTLSLGSYLFLARSDRWASPAIARFRAWLVDAIRAEIPS